MVVADPSTSNASAADRLHPYLLPEMPADMIGGTALNGILPSIFEASIPEVVVKLFHFWGFDSELIQIEEMLIKINLVHDDGERKMYINRLLEKWVDRMNVEVLRLQVENEFELRKRRSFKWKILFELKKLVEKLDELVTKASGYGLKSRNEYETLPPYWTCRSQTSNPQPVSTSHCLSSLSFTKKRKKGGVLAMLNNIINGAFKANKKQRLSVASNSTPNAAGQGPPLSTPTVPTAMVVADPSTSNASAADRLHPYLLPEMPADMIGGTALNGILPSIFEASIPQVVVKLFHFWGFESELNEIEEMLIKINLVHDDGERKMYINKLVEKWVDNVKETAYEIDDVVDRMNVEVLRLQVENEFEPRKRRSFKWKMLFELKKLVEKLDELVTKASGYGLKSRNEYKTLPPYWTCRSQTSHSVDVTEIYGRTEDKNRVISYLFDQNISNKRKYSVIGILGMGGIGKTTLAQLVFRDERVVEKFDLRSWACVSDFFDCMSVLKDLCAFAIKKTYDNNMSLAALHDESENLVRGKRILFVLDDVWTDRDEDWEILKAPFCQCAEGSVILVTSRNRSVLESMESREIHKLECLAEVHCWDLFRDRAFRPRNMNAELEAIGKKLVQKCKGVPLAAKVLSSILCGVDDKRKWINILESKFWDLPVDRDGIFPALRISYHCLPPHLKLCFLHLSLFPADYNLEKDKIVQLWIGEGLVHPKHGRELEDAGSEYYDALQERSLIEADHKLHDLVHSMARKLSKKFYLSSLDLSASSHEDARARHFWDNNLQGSLTGPLSKVVSLRTFVASFSVYGKGSLVRGISCWNYLRVLELNVSGILETELHSLKTSGHLRRLIMYGPMETLPISICRLHSLQALKLTSAVEKNLPEEIGNLISLRLLDLRGTEISHLPNSVCNLIHLRTIDWGECGRLKEIPFQIGKLQNLRNLNLGGTPVRHLPDSICSITSLEILDLTCCDELQSWPQGLSNLVNIRFLGIPGMGDSMSLPPNIGAFVRLRGLLLFGVGRETGRGIGELQHLDNITGLHLCNMENVENVEEAEMAALINKKFLEELTFRWSSTERNCGDEGGELEWKVVEALKPYPSNIKFLDFNGYGGKRLPSWIFTLHFSSLQQFIMSKMNRLTTVTTLTLNSLETLYISECTDLREVVIVAPKLKALTVESCPEMIRLSIQACSGTNNSEDASGLILDPLLHRVAIEIWSCEKLGPDKSSHLPWRINPAAAPPRDQN